MNERVVSVRADPEDIAEPPMGRDRSRPTAVPHEKVARWLGTWGTPAFKPWDGFGIGMNTDHTLEEVGRSFGDARRAFSPPA